MTSDALPPCGLYRTLSRIGEGLINMLVAGAPVDPKPLKSFFENE